MVAMVVVGVWLFLLSALMMYFACRPTKPLDIQRRLFGVDQRRVIEDMEKYKSTSALGYGLAAVVLFIAAAYSVLEGAGSESRRQRRQHMNEAMQRSMEDAKRERERRFDDEVRRMYPGQERKTSPTAPRSGSRP